MDNRIAKVIGENIRKRIDEKGLLMREVAAEVNVLEHTFFRWMRGERQPSAYALYRLARFFGCTMEDLMEEGVEEMDQEYEQFVEKFKPKRTTDDCFTPPNIYETVLMWVVQEYGIDPHKVVRPFWPGGSYETQDYPEGCTVVDNPPFSIITKIARTYMKAGIPFFLFAPYLTNFQIRAGGVTHIITDASITYENGAKVNTAFVTNLDPEFRIRTAPDLRAAIMAVEEENTRGKKKDIPKYSYPPEVITATQAGFISRYGIDLRIRDGEACWVKDLDSQKEKKKQIFGGGYLLSESAAARKAEAEEAAGRLKAERETAATCWELSDRERGIIKAMERRSDK